MAEWKFDFHWWNRWLFCKNILHWDRQNRNRTSDPSGFVEKVSTCMSDQIGLWWFDSHAGYRRNEVSAQTLDVQQLSRNNSRCETFTECSELIYLTCKSSMNCQQGRKNEHVQQKSSQREISIWCCRPNNPQVTFVSIISQSNRSIIFIKTCYDSPFVWCRVSYNLLSLPIPMSNVDEAWRNSQSLQLHIETMG